jgi:hypothetical protein
VYKFLCYIIYNDNLFFSLNLKIKLPINYNFSKIKKSKKIYSFF